MTADEVKDQITQARSELRVLGVAPEDLEAIAASVAHDPERELRELAALLERREAGSWAERTRNARMRDRDFESRPDFESDRPD